MTDPKAHTVLVLSGLMILASPSFADLHDPTRPPEFLLNESGSASTSGKKTESASATGFVLMSTMISDKRTAAVINGEVVSKGDKVGDMNVVDIKPYKVLLKGASGRMILTLINDENLTRKPVNEKAREQ